MTMNGRWSKPTLVGELVTLRPIDAGDVDVMWEMVNDPVGRDLTATTSTFTFDQIRAWCASRRDQDQRLDLAVIENKSGDVVGEVVLNEFDPQTESSNFRIALRGDQWFGRGFGTEATRLIVEHGLRVVGLRSIHLGVLQRNPRAVSTYEKVGFRRVKEEVNDGETWIEMEITP